MTAPGEASPPSGPASQQATIRGLAVLAIAIAVGGLIYWQGFKGAKSLDTAAPTTTSSPISGVVIDRNAPPPTTALGGGTSIPKPGTTKVANKDVKVMVANGVDPAKVVAGPIATKLRTSGYTVVGATDLTQPSDKSFVYYTGDLQAEAESVAQALGWPMSTATTMPGKPPTELNGAQLLVVIGKDKA